MEDTSPDRDQFGSAAEYAYALLREEIVAGRFAPGRRMREVELAERLGVSRTPTRLALSRLENEGLLDMRPRVGLVVASLAPEAVLELYETRAAFEGTAAALAARHASARDVETLQRLLNEEAALPDDALTHYRHNRLIHESIYLATHNRYLIKSLQALYDSMALLGTTTFTIKGRAATAHAEHRRIIDAIVGRRPDEAEEHARKHVNQALALRTERLGRSGGGDRNSDLI